MVWQKWVHLQRKHIDNRTIKPQTIIKQPGYVKQPETLKYMILWLYKQIESVYIAKYIKCFMKNINSSFVTSWNFKTSILLKHVDNFSLYS